MPGNLHAIDVLAVGNPAVALEEALSTGSGAVVVAGSLYLVGAARAILVDDPLLVPDPAISTEAAR